MTDVTPITKQLDKIYSHYDNVFSDWIDIMLCCLLSDRTPEHPSEQEYMRIIKRYQKEDLSFFGKAFGELMLIMQTTNEELLGLIYMQIASKYKSSALGQYFTPQPICDFIVQTTQGEISDREQKILDPACGAGAMLVAYNKVNPKAFFTGQDLDPICTKMTALNMCFFNMNGYALCGNSLSLEKPIFGYETIRSPLGGTMRKLNENDLNTLHKAMQKAFEKEEVQTNIINNQLSFF